ncbi:MAG TPA: hypothetical protein VN421_11965 [Pseudoflavonifractor sp.]|nr:hypothetical protein [Pseudoflavonifractor sp.]
MRDTISVIFGSFVWLMTVVLSAACLPSAAPAPLFLPPLFCAAVLPTACCGRCSFTAVKLRVQKLE